MNPPSDNSDRDFGDERIDESLRRGFELGWHEGERPAIDDYLPPPESSQFLPTLQELVCIELEFAWRAWREREDLKKGSEGVAKPARLEAYLERFPALNLPVVIKRLAADEYSIRLQHGDQPSIDEYRRRFPALIQEKSDLEDARSEDDDATLLLEPTARGRFPIRLNCPHCRNPIQVVDNKGTDVECPSCGSSFHMAVDRGVSWSPDRLPRLGTFQLLEAVGRGAFGTVYRARDTELDRIVAVKVPRSGRLATSDDEDRFVREGRTAAGLRHPGIVPIYQIGRDDRLAYIVSEFVEGTTLADLLTSRNVTFREAADIVAQAADALESAHRQGIVHRDVKPSNLMMSQAPRETESDSGSDARAQQHSDHWVRLMDFGLARRDDGEITITLDGQILGTPAYMSPEQARGEGRQADGRSDIYSLGAVLYQLLVGELPFRGNSRMLLQQVLYDYPQPPRKINDRIPRDLENITLKCLHKEPEKRYQSAAALSADLRNWLTGQPVSARPVSRLEKTYRWCRRNPAVASLGGAAAALLLLATLVSVVAYGLAMSSHFQAKRSRDAAFGAKLKAVQALESEQLASRETQFQLAESYLDRALKALHQQDYRAGMEGLLQAWETLPAGETRYERCIRDNLSLWSHYLPMRRTLQCDNAVETFAFSPNQQILAVSGGQTYFWDADSHEEVAKPINVRAFQMEFSPDNKSLLTLGSAARNYAVQLWDWRSGRELRTIFRQDGVISDACFSPDGRIIAVAAFVKDGADCVTLWDAESGAQLPQRLMIEGSGWNVTFDETGERVAASGYDEAGFVRIWDVATGDTLFKQTLPNGLSAVEFSPDGRLIAAGCRDHRAYVWDARTGAPIVDPLAHEGIVEHVAFHPGGEMLLTAGSDRSARLWDLTSGEMIGDPIRHEKLVHQVAFSRDGTKFLTSGLEGVVQVWETATRSLALPPIHHGDRVYCATFHPVDDSVLLGGSDGFVSIWEIDGKAPKRTLFHASSRLWKLAYTTDCRTLAAGLSANRVRLIDTQTGEQRAELSTNSAAVDVAFSDSGERVAVGNRHSAPQVWTATGEAPGESISTYEKSGMPMSQPTKVVAISGDGKMLAAGAGRVFQLWDVESRQPHGDAWRSASPVTVAAFSPTGEWIATNRDDLSLELRAVLSGQAIGPPLQHDVFGRGLAFRDDGRLLAMGGKGVHLWETPSGKALGAFALQARISSLDFSADGETLALGCEDGLVRLWNVSSLRPIGPPLPQTAAPQGEQISSLQLVTAVGFLENSRQLLSASGLFWEAGEFIQTRWEIPPSISGDREEVARLIRSRLRAKNESPAKRPSAERP